MPSCLLLWQCAHDRSNPSIGQRISDDVVPQLRAQLNVPAWGDDEVLLSIGCQFVGNRTGVQACREIKGRQHFSRARVVSPQARVETAPMEDHAAGGDERRTEVDRATNACLRFAYGDLPYNLAVVQIDGGECSPGRLVAGHAILKETFSNHRVAQAGALASKEPPQATEN